MRRDEPDEGDEKKVAHKLGDSLSIMSMMIDESHPMIR